MSFEQPAIICVAPNGARKTKKDHPKLPLSPADLADTAKACLDAGASMIHLHVRDKEDRHSLNCDLYRAAITAIKKSVGDEIIIQVTTEAVGIYTPDEQMAMVQDLKPEAVSLAIRELAPNDKVEADAADFFQWLEREAVSPQYILYDVPDLMRFQDLQSRGVIPQVRPFVLYVLGRYSKGQVSTPDDLQPFITAPGGKDCPWAVCAFGAREGDIALKAMEEGGHVRVGFENNMQLTDGALAGDNSALVLQAAMGADRMGRPIATARQAREILGLR